MQKPSPPVIDVPTLAVRFRLASELIPDPKNSRRHSLEQIHELDMAIGAYGFTNPVLVDGDKVVAGHGRREALIARRDRGAVTLLPNGSLIPHGYIPTIDCTGWTETQRRAYVIWDNKSTLNADWDEATLASELRALSETPEFDMSLTGFNESELDELLMPESTGGKTDPDAVPDKPAKPVSRAGDIWILGAHRLMCGDSTVAADVAALMMGHKADMIFTDPPYGMSYAGGRGKKNFSMIKGDDAHGDGLIQLVQGALTAARDNAKEGFAAYICLPWRTYTEFASAVLAAGLEITSCIVWNKGSVGLGHQEYRPQHEFIFYSKGTAWYGDRSQSDVWTITRGATGAYVHPTQKPVELIEIAIANSSKPRDVVLDLFGGSGSTLIACEKSNRGGGAHGTGSRVLRRHRAPVAGVHRRPSDPAGRQPHIRPGRTQAPQNP